MFLALRLDIFRASVFDQVRHINGTRRTMSPPQFITTDSSWTMAWQREAQYNAGTWWRVRTPRIVSWARLFSDT